MITTGRPDSSATKTEVVDVVNGESCADLADFPLYNRGAVAANLDGTPVVCGGYNSGYIKTCYKFTNAGWQEFADMKENRYNAAGVTYNNKFHVFGGAGGSSSRQTSELISIDGGVEYGPELPEAVSYHTITSIDSTVSLLSGGVTDATDYSPLTWYFNHETNIFSAGPSLLEGRYGHGSATIVDKVTTTKIPMVTGGYDVSAALDSTKLLINGQWQSGTIQFKKSHNILIFISDICHSNINTFFCWVFLTLEPASICSQYYRTSTKLTKFHYLLKLINSNWVFNLAGSAPK